MKQTQLPEHGLAFSPHSSPGEAALIPSPFALISIDPEYNVIPIATIPSSDVPMLKYKSSSFQFSSPMYNFFF